MSSASASSKPLLSSSMHFLRPGLCGLFVRLSAAVAGSLITAQASGTVTNCTEADLRNALIGGGFVTLACSSSIQLTSPLIVAKETVLDGTGYTPVLNGSQATNAVPIFIVQAGASLTLRAITLTGGTLIGANGANGQSGASVQGAAIYSDHGSVTLDGCTLSNHTATAGSGANSLSIGGKGASGGQAAGAAVYNMGGQLLITNSLFYANSAIGGAGGNGGAGSGGGNGSDGGRGGDSGNGSGAAVYNAAGGVVSIFSSTFSSNSVSGSVGGIGGAGGSTLGFAGSTGSSGGGMGAALFNGSGSMTIVNSTFSGNRATGSIGTAGPSGTSTQQGQPGGAGGSTLGAGIYNASGTLSITNCTFVANGLVGGLGGAGGSGVGSGFGGPGAAGGAGGNALGAGVCTAPAGATVIVNCSFSDNEAQAGSGGAGGVVTGLGETGDTGQPGQQSGGAIYSLGGVILLKNSILANSLVSANAGGVIVDSGFNLSSDGTPAFTQSSSRNRVDPLLASFANAGGITAVLTLASNSPAINAITVSDENGAPTYDQRNAFRVAPFDIGAFEFNASTTAPGLQALRTGTAMVLTWPDSGTYTLQSAPTLGSSNNWSTILAQPAIVNGLRTITIHPTNVLNFFRLTN